MALPQLRRTNTADRILGMLEDSVANLYAWLAGQPHLDARLVAGVRLAAGSSNKISHLLGRTMSGWVVVRKRATADIWEDASTDPRLFLSLETSADVEVDLLVF